MNQAPQPNHSPVEPFDFNPTIRTVFAPGALARLGELSKELGAERAFVVTDAGVAAAGHPENALASLENAGLVTEVFQNVGENPTTAHVEEGTRFAGDFEPDLLVALGGGSAMDCAKGINFLLTNGGQMEDYWGFGKASQAMLPAIGIPTTAGTGSEAQSYALIARETDHRKMACGDLKARFRVVILDPQLVLSAPEKIKAVSGMDAIAHAVESFVSTKQNPMSRMFAGQAWRLLAANYERFLRESDNIALASSMLLGAHLAGMAIENSMLGAAHACANPLTAHFGVTHGVAVALMLPHVIRFNGEAVNGEYDALLQPLNLLRQTEVRSSSQLAARVEELRRSAHLPERLRDVRVPETELSGLAKEAAQQWTGRFNPRAVREEDFVALYEMAY